MTDRREFLQGAIASLGAGAAGLSMTGLPLPKWAGRGAMAAEDLNAIRAEIEWNPTIFTQADWLPVNVLIE